MFSSWEKLIKRYGAKNVTATYETGREAYRAKKLDVESPFHSLQHDHRFE